MNKYLTLSLFLLLLMPTFINAQQPPSTTAAERLAGFEQRKALQQQSLVNNVAFQSVGPTVFGGRITDIAVHPTDPTIFYAAYASGGLWKTESNGTAFEPIFDQEAVMTIGAVAVDWERNTIWVGTGEVNSSRSSYAGVGLFRSNDGGKNWEHSGLPESHHIGRIVLHPNNPDVLWVAVLGHLYSPNQERGVYKTTDGGKSWKKVLYVHENAGAVDLLRDPANPDILYAAAWDRTRRAWDFTESGTGSGIWKSTDGGENWAKVNGGTSGFPEGEGLGRIGLSMTRHNGKPVLYALLDNYFRRTLDEKDKPEGLTKDNLRGMSKSSFLKLEEKEIAKYLEGNGFPEKYSAKKVMEMVEKEEITPLALVEYIEDANRLLFDTPVIGAELYRSDDEGKTWKKTHEGYLDNVYNSYGYYFGTISASPHDANRVYIAGVPVLRSEDGGKTFKNINGDNVHVDHHLIWVDPQRDKHLILGNDGGLNISYDDGDSWTKCNTPAVGQFYSVVVDNAKPYNIYGGLQDNGVWAGAHTYKASHRWHNSGRYPYEFLMGGDGMQVAVDSRDNNTIYTGYQFGNYFRINKKTRKRQYITPKPDLGKRPYRWNWESPIHLSVHNEDILYMGANKVLRSLDQGENFTEISGDLTTGGIKGDVAYSTLTCVQESALKFGLIYAGSDDGLIHVTKDGGNSWENISSGLPARMWVSHIEPSKYEEGRVYASLNGYRWDDFNSYLYVSEDYGENWKAIGTDLPMEPVNVVKEDPVNADLLFVGTDHGAYLSLDRGQQFMALSGGLPAVSVHDMAIQKSAKDLVIGTHGRSFWLGNIAEIQALDATLLAKEIHVFAIKKQNYSSRWGRIRNAYTEASVPEVKLPIYAAVAGEVTIVVKSEGGLELKKMKQSVSRGLNYPMYDLSIGKKAVDAYRKEVSNKERKDPIKVKAADNGTVYLQPGKYTVLVTKAGKTVEEKLEIVKR